MKLALAAMPVQHRIGRRLAGQQGSGFLVQRVGLDLHRGLSVPMNDFSSNLVICRNRNIPIRHDIELNGSLSGSARFTSLLADYGKRSIFAANRPY